MNVKLKTFIISIVIAFVSGCLVCGFTIYRLTSGTTAELESLNSDIRGQLEEARSANIELGNGIEELKGRLEERERELAEREDTIGRIRDSIDELGKLQDSDRDIFLRIYETISEIEQALSN